MVAIQKQFGLHAQTHAQIYRQTFLCLIIPLIIVDTTHNLIRLKDSAYIRAKVCPISEKRMLGFETIVAVSMKRL